MNSRVVFSPDLAKLLKSEAGRSENVRLGFRAALRLAQEYARDHHRYKSKRGDVERATESRLTSTSPLVGELFINSRIAPHGIYIHAGTRPHIIRPRDKRALRWVSGGRFAFAKQINHPGTRPDPFLYEAVEKTIDKGKELVIKALEKEGF